ncbi:uncharacterized protein VTP21DRAFT_6330 [Calcarisporiella thermophila]|uniref:uncharacterized protein n=1 Tax=Calcarisporiella thermophila TaxID=911321 RepID=UPI0037436F93
MLAIGSKIFNRPDDLTLAKKLLDTCIWMYSHTVTGLSPEIVGFLPEQKDSTFTIYSTHEGLSYYDIDTHYHLRPETVESLFILWRITGDVKYVEAGWEIFKAIEKWCRTDVGYSALKDVNYSDSKLDSLESFFFAETLKYLYLLFSPPNVLDLDKYVFSTEAHPFMRGSRLK